MTEDHEQPGSAHWHSAVEAPERVADARSLNWDDTADLVIVGFGGAGSAAAVQAAQLGLSVIALDASAGGGSTAINGGIVYAGGGTAIQKQAGVEDSVQAMFDYLRTETQGVVSDATLRRFCDGSVEMIDWLASHGVRFDATHYEKKTSYPPPGYHLYHSDSTLAASRAAIARPAARGHKLYTPPSRSALGFGKQLTEPMTAAAAKLGVKIQLQSEARRLVQDAQGRVIGVAVLQFADAAARDRYAALQAKAQFWGTLLPPAFPGAKLTFGLARWYTRRAQSLEPLRTLRRIRAKKAVCLSAGGFVFNEAMVKHYAPKYAMGMPLGQPRDDGSGIRLGQSAGGAVARMSHLSAWRFIRPPAGLSRGAIVNRRGARFVDETLYGAAIGYEMIEHHDGAAWVILDQPLYEETLKETKSKELYSFQSGPAMLALKFAREKAPTLEALAARCGFDAATLKATVEAVNAAAAGKAEDPFQKAAAERRALTQGPYYAIDIGVGSRLFPLPVLSLGGLKVNEDTGAVLDAAGAAIAGLYAAGRNAIGVCSHLYVSGLSVADCVFSGRRAARSAALD